MPRGLTIGSTVNQRYRVEQLLGSGGAGMTYLARDLTEDRQVALKALWLQGVNDWKALELFQREAKALQGLSHPLIPAYLDQFEASAGEESVFVLVQSLAQGETLAQRVANGWRASETEATELARRVLTILVYLQSRTPAVIHRDIKPSNLICADDGSVYLVDFGSVRMAIADTTRASATIVGTYGYMAPEQYMGKATLGTDCYGLATTLIHALSGKHPVDLPQHELRIDFSAACPLSSRFGNWLARMLSPTTEGRFANAQAALDALNSERALAPLRPAATAIALTERKGQLTIEIPAAGWHGEATEKLLFLLLGLGLWLGWLFLARLWNLALPLLISLLLVVPFSLALGRQFIEAWQGRTTIALDHERLIIERRVWGSVLRRSTTGRAELVGPDPDASPDEWRWLTRNSVGITLASGLTTAERDWLDGELLQRTGG